MYKGKGWEVLLPTRMREGMVGTRAYTIHDLHLVRGTDSTYDQDFTRKLEKARVEALRQAREAGRDLRDNKLLGLDGVREVAYEIGDAESSTVVRLNQMTYLNFGAMALMEELAAKADRGEPIPEELREIALHVPNACRENIGFMSTVRTADGRTMHSRRTTATASWAGYDSLFGAGLTGPENGDVDKVERAGLGRIRSLMAERVATELGVSEGEIDNLQLLGIVRGFTYRDHIFSFDTVLSVESGKILAEKGKTLAKLNGKYEDIFDKPATPEEQRRYLREGKILEVALGALVLMGRQQHLFGKEWVEGLKADGVVE